MAGGTGFWVTLARMWTAIAGPFLSRSQDPSFLTVCPINPN